MKQIAKKIYNLFTYFNPEVKKNFETSKIGTIYGGYDIYEKFLKNPVVISCGLGEDASFDIDMINKYKARSYKFKPLQYFGNGSSYKKFLAILNQKRIWNIKNQKQFIQLNFLKKIKT